MVYLFSESFLFWCHSTLLCFVPLYFTVNHLSLINDNFLWIGGHRELVVVPSASDSVIPSCFHISQVYELEQHGYFSPFTTEPHSFSSCLFRCAFNIGTVRFSVQAFSFDARISLILSILYPGQETTSGAVLLHHC